MERKNLVLCRTPFQARFLIHLVEANVLDCFELLYLTNNDSDQDKYYFNKLSLFSISSSYIRVIGRKTLFIDLIVLAYFYSFYLRKKKYKKVFVSNINHIFFRVVIKSISYKDIVSYDDGTANIFSSSRFYNPSFRSKIFSKIARVPCTRSLVEEIKKHYSIYEGFENIVPVDLVEVFNIFDIKNVSNKKSRCCIFIGQPFHEYLSQNEICLLSSWLSSASIDYYVRHPREINPLVPGIEVLDTKGMIIEDFICEEFTEVDLNIYAAFSSVLFNIKGKNVNKFYLGFGNEDKYINLVLKTDSNIINISDM